MSAANRHRLERIMAVDLEHRWSSHRNSQLEYFADAQVQQVGCRHLTPRQSELKPKGGAEQFVSEPGIHRALSGELCGGYGGCSQKTSQCSHRQHQLEIPTG